MNTLFEQRTAVISECGHYRYSLTRTWDDGLPGCVYVMLNPSKADASRDDPTIRRCLGFARRERFGSLTVVNLFAYRATKPRDLLKATHPIGPENDAHIKAACTADRLVIAAWGAQPIARKRTAAVLEMLAGLDVYCLGRTQEGQPNHPLMLRNDQPLELYRPIH